MLFSDNNDFDDLLSTLAGALKEFHTDEVKPFMNAVTYGRKMRTNIREYKDSFVFDIELPGFKKEDIDVELEKGYLKVSAHMKDEAIDKKVKSGEAIMTERSYESVSRSYHLGESFKPEDVKARYENGELIVTVKKKEPEKPLDKKISID